MIWLAVLIAALYVVRSPRIRTFLFTATAVITVVGASYPHPALRLVYVGFSFWVLFVGWAFARRLSGQTKEQAKSNLVLGLILLFGPLLLFKLLLVAIPDGLIAQFQEKSPGFSAGILIPLGMSYFSFRSAAYLIEVYRGNLEPQKFLRFVHYALFWPTLQAGPIERPGAFFAQIDPIKRPENGDLAYGFYRIAGGFFKKSVIAAIFMNIARPYISMSDGAFAQGMPGFSPGYMWICVTAYYGYLYFDFSGYSDLAIGASRMMGFKIMENFRYPILATNVADFWRRWHISLTSWVTDYIYIGLGGNRSGAKKAAINTMIAMVVVGAWHGLNLHFLFWGAWHGAFLILYRQYRNNWKAKWFGESGLGSPRIQTFLGWLFTFLVVNLGWVLFIHKPSHAFQVWARLFGLG
jgi:alginate O-acetyltransferase complex protein AlgI